MSDSTSKVMLINVTHAEESRVAILSDGIIESFEIETVDRKSRKGDIYTGRVESVQPALQAAFVDIGDERSAFLPLDELNFAIYPSRKEGTKGRIENHLHRGQNVLVQIVRDAYANKPPTLSTYYSLPGRFLVLTPGHNSAGVSRKLDDKQREKIRKLLDELKPPDPHGLIVRTAASGATKTDLKRDVKYLLRLWEQIEQAASSTGPGRLIYKERSMVIRAMRDLFTSDIEEILVDDQRTYDEIVEFMNLAAPTRTKIVKLHQGHRPLFNKYNLEDQLENIFRRRVPLESGGAVIFDPTEALTAVDVNSGKMKKDGHIEDTALRANLEAAREIGRQLRLRDLGGLIVIDFIDMRAQKNVRQVERAMKDALRRDKAKHDVTRISRLGLMEISRERVGAQKSSLRYRDCPVCAGTGSIKTIEAAAVQALRRLQTRVVRADLEELEISLPPDVADYLQNHKRAEIGAWEQRYDVRLSIISNPSLGRDDYEVRTVNRARAAATEALVAPPTGEQIISAFEEDEGEDEPAAGEESDGAAPRKKRRRRRRRRKSSEGDADAVDAEDDADEAAGMEPGGDAVPEDEADEPDESNGAPRRKRRRRRRRKSSEGDADAVDAAGDVDETEDAEPEGDAMPADEPAAADAEEGQAAGEPADSDGVPRKKRRRRRRRRRRTGGDDRADETDRARGPQDDSGMEDQRDEPPLAVPVGSAVMAADSGGPVPRLAWWKRLIGDGE